MLQQSRPITANDERNRCDNKDILWAFVFGSRIAQNCALSQLSLCTHKPDRSLYNSFSISGPSFFWSPRFTKYIGQVPVHSGGCQIWQISGARSFPRTNLEVVSGTNICLVWILSITFELSAIFWQDIWFSAQNTWILTLTPVAGLNLLRWKNFQISKFLQNLQISNSVLLCSAPPSVFSNRERKSPQRGLGRTPERMRHQCNYSAPSRAPT